MNSQGRIVKIHFSIRNTIPDTNVSPTTTIQFLILFSHVVLLIDLLIILDKPNTS